jgi:hypothetical protein
VICYKRAIPAIAADPSHPQSSPVIEKKKHSHGTALRRRRSGGAARQFDGRAWTPEEVARREFELLRLLSQDRRAEACARRMGLFGAEALPSAVIQPAGRAGAKRTTGSAANDVERAPRKPRKLTAARDIWGSLNFLQRLF